jgi:hypothetical protein
VTYRDKLLALLERWEKTRGSALPTEGRDSRTIVGWIRMAITEADNGRIDLAQQNLGRLGCHLAKTEQELRDITRDRDRWRRRAVEAEALANSLGRAGQNRQANAAGNRS